MRNWPAHFPIHFREHVGQGAAIRRKARRTETLEFGDVDERHRPPGLRASWQAEHHQRREGSRDAARPTT